jgi:hypothetical protein
MYILRCHETKIIDNPVISSSIQNNYQWSDVIKSSRATSRVNVELQANISGISFVSIIRTNININPHDGDRGDPETIGI